MLYELCSEGSDSNETKKGAIANDPSNVFVLIDAHVGYAGRRSLTIMG